MYGTVRYLGNVDGKPGRFAGIELTAEHANKWKNSGDVDGRTYFNPSVPGAGIFVPMNASKYANQADGHDTTPSRPSITNFSKSVGPGPPAAPRPRLKRPSLP
jgi:dynactin complex subunit